MKVRNKVVIFATLFMLLYSCTTAKYNSLYVDKFNKIKVDKRVPKEFYEPSDKKGTIETISYDTYFYAYDIKEGNRKDNWHSVTKKVNVYLPYNYDANTSYNILYLLHGGGGNEDEWFSTIQTEPLKLYEEADRSVGAWFAGYWAGQENGKLGEGSLLKILDNMIAKHLIEPVLVVTPTMYYRGDTDLELPPDTEGIYPETFYMELQNDIIPAVESKYSTYAKSVSEKDIIASRDHRAMAGLSMGSWTTWLSGLGKSLPYISWFGNFSAGVSPFSREETLKRADALYNEINSDSMKDYKINLLLSFNGTSDMAHDNHVTTFNRLIELSDGSRIVEGENAAFFDYDKWGHAWYAWITHAYNTLNYLFK